MLSIIIVDDEETIRLGLAKVIHEIVPFSTIAASCSDGEEALEWLEHCNGKVDVIVTDIRMPNMNGIELVEVVRTNYPHIRCILLSGFNDFEYARQGLRFGVKDYLLKPFDKDELKQLLTAINEDLVADKEELEHMRQGLYTQMLDGDPSAFGKYNYRQDDKFALIAAKFSHPDCWEPFMHTFHSNSYFEAALKREPYGIIVLRYPNTITSAHALANIKLAADAAVERLYKSGQGLALVGESELHSGPSSIHTAFVEARIACNYGLYGNGGYIVTSTRHVNCRKMKDSEVHGLMNRFAQACSSKDTDLSDEVIQHLFRVFKEHRASIEQMMACVDRLQYILGKEVLFSPATGLWSKELEKLGSLREMEASTTRLAHEALRIEVTDKASSKAAAVERVKRYVHENYHTPISMEDVAHVVHLNANYISQLFKQETGETFTEYVTRFRLNRAKYLLREHPELLTYEVGNLVGYPEQAYFNKLFKKEVGVTPNKYRNLNVQETLNKEQEI
ncbi:response regulator [Paenibacillus sp. KQZ6P-2]|uniref:Response regulator n=1 Tax=Paenibacillus mangrovi TaxID=2931978 RepID=A0A9X1WTS7_9BACL|nr:response regulator [Paenibacillus mangrovi]MCJ8013490.1 response regulator [Paenibacillus mangrovi]